MNASNRKIKVAHVVNYLGGAGKELGILKLADHLDKTRFESYIIVINALYDGHLPTLDHYNIIQINAPTGNKPALPFKLAKIFRQQYFDIIHTHSWVFSFPYKIFGRWFSIRKGYICAFKSFPSSSISSP